MKSLTTDGALVGAVGTVHFGIADLVGGEADRGVVGAGIFGRFTHGRFTRLLIGAVLAVDVPVTHPALRDAFPCGEENINAQE